MKDSAGHFSQLWLFSRISRARTANGAVRKSEPRRVQAKSVGCCRPSPVYQASFSLTSAATFAGTSS
jgi:hypothetical protein